MDLSEGGSPPAKGYEGGCLSSQAMEFDWLPAGATPDMLAAEARGTRPSKKDKEHDCCKTHRLVKQKQSREVQGVYMIGCVYIRVYAIR